MGSRYICTYSRICNDFSQQERGSILPGFSLPLKLMGENNVANSKMKAEWETTEVAATPLQV